MRTLSGGIVAWLLIASAAFGIVGLSSDVAEAGGLDPEWGNLTASSPVCNATGNQQSAQLVPDGQGGAIITWYDYRSGTGTISDIYAQRVDHNGSIIWPSNGVVVCDASQDQYTPEIVPDGEGGAIIVWRDCRNEISTTDLYAQRVDKDGTPMWFANGVAITTVADNQMTQSLIQDGTGGAIMSWVSGPSFGNYNVFAQRVTRDGVELWGVDGTALATATGYQWAPTLLQDGQGGAIFTWINNSNSPSNYQVMGQRVNATGTLLWGAQGKVVCSDANFKQSIGMITDGKGGAIINWQDWRSSSMWEIYAERVDSMGDTQWTAGSGKKIVTYSNYQWTSSDMIPDGKGGALLAYNQDLDDDNDHDLYLTRFDMNGELRWGTGGILVNNAPTDAYSVSLISDGRGGAIAAWFEASGDYDIFAQRVYSNLTRLAYLPSPPFRINNNAELAARASSGSGTAGDPWVIEDLEINSTGEQYCIYIGNTTEHFLLQRCKLTNSSGAAPTYPYYPGSGLILNNVTNGRVEASNISENTRGGVFMEAARNVTVQDCVIFGNTYAGIWMWGSNTNCMILTNDIMFNDRTLGRAGVYIESSNTYNNITGNNHGIEIWNSDGNNITSNYISDCFNCGIYATGVSGIYICANNITDNNYGIQVWGNNNYNISYNNISLASNYGIWIVNSGWMDIFGNNISQCTQGGIFQSASNWNDIIANDISSCNDEPIHLFSNSNNNNINDNRIHDNDPGENSRGVWIESCGSNALRNNDIWANLDGVFIEASSNVQVIGNNVTSNNGQGIELASVVSGARIDGNNLSGNTNGASFGTSSTSNTLSNNTIYGSFMTALVVQGGSYNNVTGNIITNGNSDGIFLSGANFTTVAGNNVTNCTDAIKSDASSYCQLAFNDLWSNRGSGIHLQSGSDSNNVTMNNASLNPYGLWIASASDNCEVSGNNFTWNSDSGLYMTSSTFNNVSSNNLSNNAFYGARLYASEHNAIFDNDVWFEGVGIYMELNDRFNDITGNEVQSHSTYGISFGSGSSQNNVTLNHVAYNTGDGIYIGASSNWIRGNNVTWNSGRGVSIFNSGADNTTVSNNELSNNLYGVYVLNSAGNRIYHNNISANTNQAYDDSAGANFWDDGYPSGGNWWSDYSGSDLFGGPAQDQPGSDGIGDDRYNSSFGQGILGGTCEDRYPLMDPSDASDNYGPVSSVDSIPGYWYNAYPFTITATAYDARGTVTVVGLYYSHEGGAYQLHQNDTVFPWTWNFDWPSGNGNYTFYTIAWDDSGNAEAAPGVADESVGYDAAMPSSSVGAIAAYWQNTAPFAINATASDAPSGLAYVELWYSFEGGAYQNFSADTAAPWSWGFTWPSGSGNYTFYTRAVDLAGNYEAAPGIEDESAGYDAVLPSSNVDTISNNWYNTATLTITATAADVPSGIANVTLWYSFENGTNVSFGVDSLAPWSWDFGWPSGEGNYSFYTIAVDNIGNVEAAPGTPDENVGYDITPPAGSVNPVSPYWQASPQCLITTTANDTPSYVFRIEFYCRFSANNITFGPWAGFLIMVGGIWPFNYTFSDGAGYYEFEAVAEDRAGNKEVQTFIAESACAYDPILPVSNVDALNPSWTATSPRTITATANDNFALASVSLYYAYSLNNVSWPALNDYTFFGALTNTPWSWNFNFPNGTGHYRFYTLASDNASNIEALISYDAYCLYDDVPPASNVIAISDPYLKNAAITISATVSDNVGSAIYNVTLYYAFSTNNITWPALGQYTMFAQRLGGPWQWNFNFPAGEGHYRFFTLAKDNATNQEALNAYDAACGYDAAAPLTSVDSIPSYWQNTTPLTITATASDSMSGPANVTLWYSHDSGTWTAFGTLTAAPWSWSFAFPQGEGGYQFRTTSYDNAGNFEAAPAGNDTYCALDTVPPEIVESCPPEGTTGDPYWFNGTANGAIAAYVVFWLGADAQTNATMTISSGAFSHQIGVPSNRSPVLYFYMSAVDAAGNWNSTALRGVPVLDNDPPVVDAGPGMAIYAGTTVSFNASGSTDNIGIANYSWSYFDGIGTINLYGLAPSHNFIFPGNYTVFLNASDAAGNRATDTVNVSVYAPLPDRDGDGTPDVNDTDDDGDGANDAEDDFPLNPNETVDTDGDGIGNNADSDDDGDGAPDAQDAFPLYQNETVDTDGDGIGNNADADDDGDGVPDSADAFPLNRNETLDTDGDGIGNNADSDDDNDGVPDSQDFAPLDANISGKGVLEEYWWVILIIAIAAVAAALMALRLMRGRKPGTEDDGETEEGLGTEADDPEKMEGKGR